MKKLINLEENLIEVPNKVRRYFSNIIGYFISGIYIEHVKEFDIERAENLEVFLKKFYYCENINLKVFSMEDLFFDIIVPFSFKDIISKYGVLDIDKGFLFFGVEDKNRIGYFKWSDNKPTITITKKGIKEALNYSGLLYLERGENFKPSNENYYLENLSFREIKESIEGTTEFLLDILEHEFIHLIQNWFFSEFIPDSKKEVKTYIDYVLKPNETNPLLITELSKLRNFNKTHSKDYEISKEILEDFIGNSIYFNSLKNYYYKLYKKMVSAFYQLVDERLGIK